MLVGSLVVLGLKIPGVEAISMFVGVALIQPALYVVCLLYTSSAATSNVFSMFS